MHLKKILPQVVFLFLVIALPHGVSSAIGIEDIMAEIDSVSKLNSDMTALVEITQEKEGEGTKVYESIYYRRDNDDAFLILMTAPEVERGNGYLRSGDNFWMYRRNTRTFQHIIRDESIAGTDARGEDFEGKKLVEMYRPAVDESGKEMMAETKLGNIPVYRFEIKAKTEGVLYPKQIYWVRQDNLLPLKIESFSLNGTLMLTTLVAQYTKIEGKFINIKTLFIDEFEKGNKTLLELKAISLKPIDNYVFTRAFLENLSK